MRRYDVAVVGSWWIIALLLVGGCGGKKPVAPSVPSGGGGASDQVGASDDVQIEIDYGDLDELDLVELNRVTTDCGDLLKLEPTAMLGKLSDAQVRCLNEGLDTAERQTVKNKISRVLLQDAWAKGDTHRWAGVAARHLEEIDRSDPDLIYQFCWHLVQLGNPDRMDEAVYWAGVALENKAAWEGELHVKRVYSLHKFRTTAALKKWEYLEARYSAASAEADLATVDSARNELKNYAKEWLEYAKVAGRDRAEPMRVCSMAAGTSRFCDEL